MAPFSQSASVACRLRGLLGLVLQQREHGRGQRGDLADRHGSDIPELGTVGGVHYAASSVMVSDAKSGSAPSRRGRAMAK